MEGKYDNAVLDFAVFHTVAIQNRFDAIVCRKGITEKLATGFLDQLALHLPEANDFCSRGLSDNFKLEPDETTKDFSWFTKSTVSDFLSLVNAPELLKSAGTIENEIFQLEDTIKFHLALYTKDIPTPSAVVLGDSGNLKDDGLTPKDKADKSSDATKNELLRAMDVRLMALREELSATFSQALGAAYSIEKISNLIAFCQYFGAAEMRNSLLNYLELGSKEQAPNASDQLPAPPHDLHNNGGKTTEAISQTVAHTNGLKSVRTGVSPAKIAQAEREISSESEESSDSSDLGRSFAERSRPLIRAASPRRSASPMRRIQIGKSGSRRPTALTIKSLNYFPARERTCKDVADGRGSGDEESDLPPSKNETSVRRMSVQDAINLFESKQRDQNLNTQSRKMFSEVSASTSKSVLRRWSAGMSESSKQCTEVCSSDCELQSNTHNPVLGTEEKNLSKIKLDSSIGITDSNKVDNPVDEAPATDESMASLPIKCPIDSDRPTEEEIQEKPTDAAEWTRQKEAELNQMLVKLMESKPSKYKSSTSGTSVNQGISGEKKTVLNSQYRDKNEEKLQVETDRRRIEKETQSKMMRETLDQRKAKVVSKSSGVPGKIDSLSHATKTRRNSSPPVLSKKETLKSAATRKMSPKTSSPMPVTRGSWSSTPSPRTAGTPPSKTSTITIATNTTPSSRKPQPVPSPSRPSLKPERTVRQLKGTNGTQGESKVALTSQEGKKHNSMSNKSAKSSKSAKTKLSAPSGNDSGAVSSKPSFYNKVTKKSSVVPLESKPFLRKGTGSGQGVGSTVAQTPHQLDDSSRTSGNIVPDEEKESAVGTTEAISQLPTEGSGGTMTSDDKKFEDTINHDLNCEITEILGPVADVDNTAGKLVDFSHQENQPDEGLDISSSAWVEIDHEGVSESCESGMPQVAASDIAPVASSSPRIRHSLSQMLQADNGEPEILEWGNAENPPALIYQKDSPKGLKRLLKFARKSREVNLAGWSSPSVFSEGEEDTEEARTNSKRSTDALLRKATRQTKGSGRQKTALSESYDGGFSSKRSMDHSAGHDILPGTIC
uniref:Uncharacterized protein n=1 Tax=Anthurium amnicola TaxID=1678845 RepID=A0A1D1XKM6_9ARAE